MYIRDYIPVGYVGENVAHYKDLCCIGAGGKEAESAKVDSPNLATRRYYENIIHRTQHPRQNSMCYIL